jgi:hypothetical protein
VDTFDAEPASERLDIRHLPPKWLLGFGEQTPSHEGALQHTSGKCGERRRIHAAAKGQEIVGLPIEIAIELVDEQPAEALDMFRRSRRAGSFEGSGPRVPITAARGSVPVAVLSERPSPEDVYVLEKCSAVREERPPARPYGVDKRVESRVVKKIAD